jgi:hypothetical protein
MAYYFNQETEESVWDMPGEVQGATDRGFRGLT